MAPLPGSNAVQRLHEIGEDPGPSRRWLRKSQPPVRSVRSVFDRASFCLIEEDVKLTHARRRSARERSSRFPASRNAAVGCETLAVVQVDPATTLRLDLLGVFEVHAG